MSKLKLHISPASAGVVTIPIGHGRVFGKKLPDLFVVNSPDSTHPGLFLYEFMNFVDGRPSFRRRAQLTHPFKGLLPPPGTVVQIGTKIHGFWIVEGNIVAHTVFDPRSRGFIDRKELHISRLPSTPASLGFIPQGENSGTLLMDVPKSHGGADRNIGKGNDLFERSASSCHDELLTTRPVDVSVMYQVHLSQFLSSPSHSAKRIPVSGHEIAYGFCSISSMQLGFGAEKSNVVVTGSVGGSMYGMASSSAGAAAFGKRRPLLDLAGNVLVNPVPRALPLVYPGPKGEANLIVGGEGGLQFYEYVKLNDGHPVYRAAAPVHEVDAMLYLGSNAVISAVDWNSNGKTDIVAGNSEGLLQIFFNVGSDRFPEFLPGLPLFVEGKPVKHNAMTRPLAGNARSMFGYTAPAAVDWNLDGLPDIITSDANGNQVVYLNAGEEGEPKAALQRPKPLLLDSLPLKGPWRVKPAIGTYKRRMVYITIDNDDSLHLYFKVDDFNLKDGGRLRMVTGKHIKTHNMIEEAERGRISIELADFDLDGTIDILLSVPRHASVPEPDSGIPQAQGVPGASLIYLKGKDKAGELFPRFQSPELIHFDGHPLFLGHADGSAISVNMGSEAGPHIMAADPGGRLIYYVRNRLSCTSYNQFPKRGKAPAVEFPMGTGAIKQLLEDAVDLDSLPTPCDKAFGEAPDYSPFVEVQDAGPAEVGGPASDPQVVEAGFALVVLALVLGAAVQVLKLPIVRRRFKSSKASSKDLV